MSADTNTGPVAREGYPFVLATFAAAALTAALSVGLGIGVLTWVALPLFGATFFTLWFFRNPERTPPSGEGLVISPADGRVIEVLDVDDRQWGAGRSRKVSIFMSVFDVHVNRAPIGGQVVRRRYVAGRFLVASLDKASTDNERSGMTIADDDGRRVVVVQIAGLVARRIVTYPQEGDAVEAGQRYGLIRFGSRLELYLPPDCDVRVAVGDRTVAGVTVIGTLPGGAREEDDAAPEG